MPQPHTVTTHRAMRNTSLGVSEAAPCCAGLGDPQTLPVSFAWVALEGTEAWLHFMGATRQTFSRSWLHF